MLCNTYSFTTDEFHLISVNVLRQDLQKLKNPRNDVSVITICSAKMYV